MPKKLVAVTIPIYKETLDDIEQISLQQAFKVLGKHPIIFFASQSLNISWYEAFCSQLGNFSIERFDDNCFAGIPGYNKLMLSKAFYARFSNYEYILIYQLDAFVFRDELKYWCEFNYDYVAAPHLKKLKNSPRTETVNQQGISMSMLSMHKAFFKILKKIGVNKEIREIENGGLSLRKVSSCLLLLTLFKKKSRSWSLNEDTFYFYGFNFFFFLFHLPDERKALSFSFELEPSVAYKLNKHLLPFGCHAFMKYEPNFWASFINKTN